MNQAELFPKGDPVPVATTAANNVLKLTQEIEPATTDSKRHETLRALAALPNSPALIIANTAHCFVGRVDQTLAGFAINMKMGSDSRSALVSTYIGSGQGKKNLLHSKSSFLLVTPATKQLDIVAAGLSGLKFRTNVLLSITNANSKKCVQPLDLSKVHIQYVAAVQPDNQNTALRQVLGSTHSTNESIPNHFELKPNPNIQLLKISPASEIAGINIRHLSPAEALKVELLIRCNLYNKLNSNCASLLVRATGVRFVIDIKK